MRKIRILLLRLCFMLIALLAIFVRPRFSLESDIAFTLEGVGYLFLLAGLAIRMWSTLYIGGRKSRELVTDGPYSLCRNPLYVGTFFLAVGAGLCFENIPMLVATVAIVLPVHVLVSLSEERHLEMKFPQEYPAYRQRVPRFFPRLRNYNRRDTVTVSVRNIRRAMIDAIGVLLIPEIEDLLEVLHQHNIVPVLWQFP